jgi:hypothetical protein
MAAIDYAGNAVISVLYVTELIDCWRRADGQVDVPPARTLRQRWLRVFGPPCLIVLLAVGPAHADERRNVVRVDVGLFSTVGFVGMSYGRAVTRWLVLEGGVGLGLTGVQLSLTPRLALGRGAQRFVAGAGLAVAIPTVAGYTGDPGYLRGSSALFLNVDLAGYEVSSPDRSLTFQAAAGVTTLVYSPGDPGLEGALYPQVRVGVGGWF